MKVDLTQGMLRELDERAVRLNVSRQAVIMTLLRQATDHRTVRQTAGGLTATSFPATAAGFR